MKVSYLGSYKTCVEGDRRQKFRLYPAVADLRRPPQVPSSPQDDPHKL
jgi:hypothetical protein